MDRRGFFGGLVGAVAGLMGLGCAKVADKFAMFRFQSGAFPVGTLEGLSAADVAKLTLRRRHADAFKVHTLPCPTCRTLPRGVLQAEPEFEEWPDRNDPSVVLLQCEAPTACPKCGFRDHFHVYGAFRKGTWEEVTDYPWPTWPIEWVPEAKLVYGTNAAGPCVTYVHAVPEWQLKPTVS